MKNRYRENGDGDISEGDSSTSLMRKAWQEKLPEAVRTQIDEDATYFIHQSLSTPCLNVQAGGNGIYIEDTSGNRIIDFHGNSVHHVGHGNPRVFHALVRQARVLPFAVRRYTNEPAIKLAKKLASITPEGISRSLFCPGGTDAIEMAMKLAIGVTGRIKFLSFWDSFHGAGFGASSIGGERLFREGMPLLAGTLHVAPPDCYRCPHGHDAPEVCDLECARMMRYVLEREGDIAAIVAEAIRSVPYIPPKEYWGIVREACDESGTLLVFDEIPQGLGKTGRMFTFEHFDVIPDIIVAGKALGGGYVPIAAMICRGDLNVVKNKAIGHYTHEKNPIACAVALETINIIEELGLVKRAKHMGERMLKRLHEMEEEFEIIGDVRGKGLLLGIELVKDRDTRERNKVAAEAIMYDCLDHGLSFKVSMGNVLSLYPPMIITDDELDNAMDILHESIKRVNKNE